MSDFLKRASCFRPKIDPLVLSAAAALYFTAVLNFSFWRCILAGRPLSCASVLFALGAVPLMFSAYFWLFEMIIVPYAAKPLLAALLLLSSAANYCMKNLLGAESHEKYLFYKQAVADRSPKELGSIVKTGEVLFHHEVTTQQLWNRF